MAASRQSSSIQFHFTSGSFYFPRRTEVKQFIANQVKREGKKIDHINYIFCSDEYLLELNKTHLKHHTLTDIITFELSPAGEPLLADIYISIERVKDNAISFQQAFTREFHRVLFHGALHLCGYKDKSAADEKKMRSMEDAWLRLYFVPRGTK